MRLIRCFLPLFAVFPLLAAVDFQREVRPILSDNCFLCHGPDPDSRLAGMRLDTQEGAFGKRENGAPIVPGNAAASLVFQRITATDARHMPPEYSHRELTAEQIETIKTWIDEGAVWKEHWAFRPPQQPEPSAQPPIT